MPHPLPSSGPPRTKGTRKLLSQPERATSTSGVISDAVYEGRLGSIAEPERHRVIRSPDTVLVPAETGIVWKPVPHHGCTQSNEEECETIAKIVQELRRRNVVGKDGVERPMTLDDILIVAPFKLQVRYLREKLGKDVRVGSVDKFQEQEAPVAPTASN